MERSTYTLNQTVWVYFHSHATPKLKPYVITKLGRKWISLEREGLDRCRFDPSTGEVDGGDYTSPGQVYRSEGEYNQEQACKAAWNHLWSQVRYSHNRPAGLTKESIVEALKLLGLKPLP